MSDKQLAAARYYVHKIRVHQYAVDVLRNAKSLDDAKAHYDEAMRNYDGVLATCESTDEANALEMAKGSAAIDEMIEAARNGR